MDIRFTRSRHRRDVTLVTRRDGVRLSVPVFGPLDPIPHDLTHYVVERELGLRNGFWGSVADGAIFDGMRVLEGRQPPHAGERSRQLLKANHYGVLCAEVVVGTVLRVVQDERLEPASFLVEAPGLRTRKDRDALLERLRPAVEAMCTLWQEIPLGDTLLVTWPERPAWVLRREQAARRSSGGRTGVVERERAHGRRDTRAHLRRRGG
jgi:hypothetical protein